MDLFPQLRGVAAVRGRAWAERSWPRAHRADRSKPWPDTDKARELAARQIADLGGDAETKVRLAEVCAAAATKRWDELRLTARPKP